ncbi:MAG: hypothetical protein LUD17_05900 [Bacteroidales bacterium]|nr:hypothetical protein [Bacteroidales bacterium]
MRRLIPFLSILTAILGWAQSSQLSGTDYGLSFNAAKVPGQQRTSLVLNDGQPIKFKDELQISFDLELRKQEVIWGNILNLADNSGQNWKLSYIIDSDNKPKAAWIHDNGFSVFQTAPLNSGEWVPVALTLDRKHGVVKISYAGRDTIIPTRFSDTEWVKAHFGKTDNKSADVPPIIIKDVQIYRDGSPLYHWTLKQHNSEVCLDELRGSKAIANNGKWVLDNHIDWNVVRTDTVTGLFDIAISPRQGQLFIVKENEVERLDEYGNLIERVPFDDHHSLPKMPGYTLYTPTGDNLVAYSISNGTTSTFDFQKRQWTQHEGKLQDPLFTNHARAFNPADSSFYFFGGYGHFAYHNELFHFNPSTLAIEKIEYSNPVYPRFGSSMCVVGNKLYIIGGRGNQSGKQALESYYYYDMWEIDLDTRQARIVWEKPRDSEEKGWILSSTMIFNPTDSTFYAVNMDLQGGTMVQFSMSSPEWRAVSHPINNRGPYQDFDYSLCYSPRVGKFYFVAHKLGADHVHRTGIYSLNTPILEETALLQTPVEDANHPWRWIIGAAVALMLCAGLFLIARRRKTPKPTVQPEAQAPTPTYTHYEEEEEEEKPKFYDTSRSFVSLLGAFSVIDKDGQDITVSFSPRLKQLLVLLILYSEKSDKGISTDKITELIWNDKDERSARNNRNVTVRRLRVLLETVGDMQLVSNPGFMRIDFGESVVCDYHELHKCYKAFMTHQGGETDPEQRGRILELLLRGPLLPNTVFEWLDPFKGTNSSLSLDMLSHLLQGARSQGNSALVVAIAEIMLLHDPLNEEALMAECRMLSEQGKTGLAKKHYDRFCRTYNETMGEPYSTPFTDIIKETVPC